jgi:hypothetical protein
MAADEPRPDTAMASGSEAGEPGEHGHTPRPEDREALEDLEREQPQSPPMDAAEDSPAAAQAVEDDSVLPGEARDGDEDPLAPEFRDPGEV